MTKEPPKHSGWLAIDKPCGITSTRVVSIVKRYFKKHKVGHAGTLDPFASGVLPIAIGEATKTIAYAQDSSKEYIFTIQFGKQTNTLDTEGEVILESDIIPTQAELETILPNFIGEIWQTPPIFSALKIAGKRAYDLARDNQKFELAPRLISIAALSLLKFSANDKTAILKVNCGKGTYIRALARDIAALLGSCAYVTQLRRTKVGIFCEKTTISLEKIEQIVHNDSLARELRSVDLVLDDIPVLFLSEDQVPLIKFGKTILVDNQHQGILLAKYNNTPVALGTITNNYFQPTRVFNL